jgi:hypothetical protein
MKRAFLLIILACLTLSACLPSQGASPTITPVPYTLNDADQIRQYLNQWAPTARGMGYNYEVMGVTPEKDPGGNITAWVIEARDPGTTYKEGMCVVPVIGLSLIITNYLDTGRADQVKTVAPATLDVIKVVCSDAQGVQQQILSVKWADVVALGKGAITTSKILLRLTTEP